VAKAEKGKTRLAREAIEELKKILAKAKSEGKYRHHGDYEGAPGKLPTHTEDGLPIERRYRHNPKHREEPYYDRQRGEQVDRMPRGDGQEILDNSIPKVGSDRHRVGIEPETGLPVELRLDQFGEYDGKWVEHYHGYVPGG
jgi:hypothetical protein